MAMSVQKYKLFGSEVEFFLDTSETVAAPIMDEAYDLSLKLQKIFNIYDESSELSMLNRQRSMNVSPELLEVMSKALKLCEESKGEYDISLGRQFLQRKKGEEIQETNERTYSYKDIDISGNKISILNEAVIIDLGSIAKGYIGEKIADFFLEQGIESGYVDARGDLRIFGEEREIGIKHPRMEGNMQTVKIKDKGIATSGDYMQYDKDYSNSHILNQKEIISATVVADNLTDADAYATILIVCNEDTRDKMIKKAGFPAIIIDKDLNKKYYNNFERFIINEN
jgi:thiamine biosynthesis lipoprotein